MAAEFSGDPRTLWLTEPGEDRGMELIEDFWFRDRSGRTWAAPRGTVVDGASIPRALWALVGSPYTGDYRRASIVHDVACVESEGDDSARKAADRMFFEACRAGGCSLHDSMVLYVGVRIGAWHSPQLLGLEMDAVESVRPQLTLDSADERLQRDFRETAGAVLADGETDDPDLLEARTDAAAGRLAARRAAAAQALPSNAPPM